MASTTRALPVTPALHVRGASFPPVLMNMLEGHDSGGHVELKPMMVGRDMVLVEIFEKAGVIVPEHSHDDHESVVYLVRGRMKLFIGDVWRHPVGVRHTSEALEDCVAIEIKSPPRQTWNIEIGD